MLNFKIAPMVQAPLILLIAMISMQSSGSFAKYLFGQFPILTISAMRLLLGAMILALIFKIWKIH
ncbi:EamA family transporter, partial [Yersinia pestis]